MRDRAFDVVSMAANVSVLNEILFECSHPIPKDQLTIAMREAAQIQREYCASAYHGGIPVLKLPRQRVCLIQRLPYWP